ncbi:hypothetical protein RJ55_03815 [Drechmeria coniospora]|nr:hypothetical protein RJ55_03815 [Drechmeria coniospora]
MPGGGQLAGAGGRPSQRAEPIDPRPARPPVRRPKSSWASGKRNEASRDGRTRDESREPGELREPDETREPDESREPNESREPDESKEPDESREPDKSSRVRNQMTAATGEDYDTGVK